MDDTLESIIRTFAKTENNSKFIFEKDLHKLNLTNKERSFIIDELQKQGINIKKSRATRPKTVQEYFYGQIVQTGDYQNDIPVMAKLYFDGSGNLKNEDYDKLDTFLEESFIPNYLQMRKNIDKKTEEVSYIPSIRLKYIIELRFCELEVIHVMNYLNEKGIRVTGSSTSLIGEFENYDYNPSYRISEKKPKEIVVSPEITMEKLKKFKENNSMELRNEIILENMRLASFLAREVHKLTHIDVQELVSFGYEGLIKAVDTFDIEKGNQFSTYAYTAIRNNILRGVLKIWGYNNNSACNKLSFARTVVEKEMNTTLQESPEIADDIIELLLSKGQISLNDSKNYKRMLLLNIPQNLDEQLDNVYINPDNPDEYLTGDYNNSLLIDDNSSYEEKCDYSLSLKEVLSTLTPREQTILKLYFGLDNNAPLCLQECGNLFGISESSASKIKNHALRKLNKPNIRKKLAGML